MFLTSLILTVPGDMNKKWQFTAHSRNIFDLRFFISCCCGPKMPRHRQTSSLLSPVQHFLQMRTDAAIASSTSTHLTWQSTVFLNLFSFPFYSALAHSRTPCSLACLLARFWLSEPRFFKISLLCSCRLRCIFTSVGTTRGQGIIRVVVV